MASVSATACAARAAPEPDLVAAAAVFAVQAMRHAGIALMATALSAVSL